MIAPAKLTRELTRAYPYKPAGSLGTARPSRPLFLTSTDPGRAAVVPDHLVPAAWALRIVSAPEPKAAALPAGPARVERGKLTVVVDKEFKNPESGYKLAVEIADITEELLSIAGLSGKYLLTITLGKGEKYPAHLEIKNQGIRSKGFELFLDYDAIARPMADIFSMDTDARMQYVVDYFLEGKYETKIDLGVLSIILGHEIGHLRQLTGIYLLDMAQKIICLFIGPLSRYREFRADQFAIRALHKMGFVHLPLLHQRAHQVFTDRYCSHKEKDKSPSLWARLTNFFPKNKRWVKAIQWLLGSHPTDRQRLDRVKTLARELEVE